MAPLSYSFLPTEPQSNATPRQTNGASTQANPKNNHVPTASAEQLWDQTWRTEAQRLQGELTQVETRSIFVEEERQRLAGSLAITKAEKESVEMDNRKLRSERDILQSQVEELLRQQDEWLLEQGQSQSLLEQLDDVNVTVEELRRELMISESRRKILELQKEEWDEVKRRQQEEERRVREEERKKEEERQRVEAERQAQLEREKSLAEERARHEQKMREAEEAARKLREQKEKKRLEQEEKARKEREQKEEEQRQKHWAEATKREERRCKSRDREQWAPTFTGWTHKRAYERFIVLLDEFTKIKFTEEKPLTAGTVPWPVLNNPHHELDVTVLDDWSLVETFFAAVKPYPKTAKEYRDLVQNTHLAFHPDRWRGRKILQTVMDDTQREAFEQAGLKVSQAITPIWSKTKGR